jgi:hypothetical protein
MGILGVVFSSPIQNSNNLLSVSSTDQVTLGALLLLMIMGLALAVIPVVAFPILKKLNETSAIRYVVFSYYVAVGFSTSPMNSIVPERSSLITKKKGLFTLKVRGSAGTAVALIPPTVTAAATVPFSLTSMTAL